MIGATWLALGLISNPAIPPATPQFAECTPGQTEPCACTGQSGQSLSGEALCTDAGQWATCACLESWPYLGPTCGAVECAPVEPGAGGYDGDHCCTPEGACGIRSDEAFGLGSPCFEVGRDSGGVPNEEECALEMPFVELETCCRPDGQCGAQLPYANWDRVGCIEQAELAERLEGNILLVIFLVFSPFSLDDVETRSCTYPN